MGGASSFYAMLAITGFLTSLWLAGKVAKLVHVSSIVFEVAIGVVLGPQVVQLIPSALSECFTDQTFHCDQHKYLEKIANKGYKYCDLQAFLDDDKYTPGASWSTGFWGNSSNQVVIDGEKGGTYCLDPTGCGRRLLDSDAALEVSLKQIKSSKVVRATTRRLKDKKGKTGDYLTYTECLEDACKLDVALECATVPDIFMLIGHTGVAMMIFESGLHFDFEQAKTVGPWACAVAVLGTFLPLVSGALMAVAFKFDWFPDALSAGTALAPTSVGIALKLLHEAKALQEYFGQAVMTAAFVDDVLSLILFSVLFSIGDDMSFMDFLPLIGGIAFMGIAICLAVRGWPEFIKFLFDRIPEQKAHHKVTTHDEVMWFLMFLVLVAYGAITHVCGTHLWGCFIGGMSFATNHHSAHVWVKQVKRITCWFLRIFFGCTLAWSIPVKELLSPEAFLKGSLMGIGPCILTKVLCGPFMGPSRWVIGWAMVGRAEFAYFIAILAKSVNMMDDQLFAILVWALLYATIFAPMVFRKVLHRYMAKLGKDFKDTNLDSSFSGHLPDVEAEEEAEEELHMHEKLEDYQEKYKAAEEKIKTLESDLELAWKAHMKI